MPANMQAASDEILLADPSWSLFVDAMDYTNGGHYLKDYPGWGEQLNSNSEKVWKNELSPEEAVRAAQQAVVEELKKNK
jgi:hypothetical protein